MNQDIRILSAGSEEGRQAVLEVMRHSYSADIDHTKPEWALVRVVDGVPVSFITIDPVNAFELPFGTLKYGFVPDAATREDRRREGHFRGMMESAWEQLRATEVPLMVLHGEFCLYSRLGFGPYTTNLGIFANPIQVQRILGSDSSQHSEDRLQTWSHPQMQQDLLVVPDVRADSFEEAKTILKTAASVAIRTGKIRILFQLAPTTPGPFHDRPFLESPFVVMARACSASIVVQGSDPEGRRVEHTEWLKLIDPVVLLQQALSRFDAPLPSAAVSFDTEVGSVTVEGSANGVKITRGIKADVEAVRWPGYALAQLVLGFLPAEAIASIHNTRLSPSVVPMLHSLFPSRWIFSVDESWLY